jgi:hypothetical protein
VEYTYVPFPVKALKIILHELQQSGKVNISKTPEPGATPGEEAMSDDEVRIKRLHAFVSDGTHGMVCRRLTGQMKRIFSKALRKKRSAFFRVRVFHATAPFLQVQTSVYPVEYLDENEDVAGNLDDDDLKDDPILRLDVRVRLIGGLLACLFSC